MTIFTSRADTWRDCCSYAVAMCGPRSSLVRHGMMLLAVALTARPAGADSLNFMHMTTMPLASSMLIDASTSLWDRDRELPKAVEDCAPLNRDVRASSHLGTVSWQFGQLTWHWNRAADPSVTYIVCNNRGSIHELMDAGGALFGGMSSAGSAAVAPSARLALTTEPIAVPLTHVMELPTRMPPSIDTIGTVSETASDGPMLDDGGFKISLGYEQSNTFETNGLSSLPEFRDLAAIDPAGFDDQRDMAPVPEPGTLLLMATGLGVAWRVARRKVGGLPPVARSAKGGAPSRT